MRIHTCVTITFDAIRAYDQVHVQMQAGHLRVDVDSARLRVDCVALI